MDKFSILYEKYIGKASRYLDWSKINQIDEDILVNYDNLSNVSVDKKQVCAIKLNGGLGTTMGCTGPKSLLEVKEGLTFMDITIEQNKDVQLVLMDSFYTHGQTGKYLENKGINNIIQFEQSCYPRILLETNKPLDGNNKNYYYPPGHGDLLQSLCDTGTLKKLLDLGIKYAFVSNIDNLGATIDDSILNDFIQSGANFAIELTPKTVGDTKGGTLIKYDGKYKMFEVAQCSPDRINDFTEFKLFNTNNIWIKLDAVEKVVNSNYLNDIDIIINPKKLEDGRDCIQLEYAIGGMVSFFDTIRCYLVPRSRFIPVKRNDDLKIVRSDKYSLGDDWKLLVNK